MRVAILTISDAGARGQRQDGSGDAIAAWCSARGAELSARAVIPDDTTAIVSQLVSWCDGDAADLVLTTGGTGPAPRDVTPEATREIIDREIPGLAEWMRMQGMKKTRRAVLSRGIAGVRGRTIIVNLPGSPKGAVESLDAVADLLPHVVDLLNNRTEHPVDPKLVRELLEKKLKG